MTIELLFGNLCGCYQSPKPCGAPLEHILKRQLATNMNINSDYIEVRDIDVQ